MNKITKGRAALIAFIVAFLAMGGVAVASAAPAAAPAPVAGNYTAVTPTRLLDTRTTHQTMTPGGELVLKVAGTHGVPANASAVSVNVTDANATTGGFLTVYPDGAARPSASTLNFAKGVVVANEVHVALGSDGMLHVFNLAGRTDVIVDLEGFYTPVCTTAMASIAPSGPTALTHVGGSIRTGATDLGSVHLDAGVYDARVLANFTGLNSTDDAAFAGKRIFGTMVLVVGDEIAPDFSNDITEGGVEIPQANSATLTIDPTASLSTFVTIPAGGSDVHVMAFAYDDDSSSTGTEGQPGAGAIKATVQSAQFRSAC